MLHNLRKNTSNYNARRRSTIALFLVIPLLLLVSLACDYAAVVNWTKTVAYNSPTVTPTSTLEPTQTPVDLSQRSLSAGRKQILVILDPLGERDVSSVGVTIYDAERSFLVETNDPTGRYLPSAQIILKDREPTQQVFAVQIGSTWQWGFITGENLDPAPFTGELLGTVPLSTLHTFLKSYYAQGVNLIMPLPDPLDENQQLDVYSTVSGNTALAVPQGTVFASAAKQANPAKPAALLSRYAIFSFLTVPPLSIPDYVRSLQTIAVSDYRGITNQDVVWAQLKVKESRDGLSDNSTIPEWLSTSAANWMKYDPVFIQSLYFFGTYPLDTKCTDQKQQGLINVQDPLPDTPANALTQKVILYTCATVITEKQYQTEFYVSPTTTPSFTPTQTLSPTITLTPTSTISLTASATTRATSTIKPTSTSKTLVNTPTTPATATNTVTPGLPITNTPIPSITPTSTTTPAIVDEFSAVVSPDAFNNKIWETVDYPAVPTSSSSGATASPTPGVAMRVWASEGHMRQSLVQGGRSLRLQTIYECLFGEARFRVLTHDNYNGAILMGYISEDYQNGVYIETSPNDTDNTRFYFSAVFSGLKYSQEFTLNSSSHAFWHSYRIVWAEKSDYSVTTELYVDGATTPAATLSSNGPVISIRLPFALANKSYNNGVDNWIDVDSVAIYGNCTKPK